MVAALTICVILLPFPAYWHTKGRPNMRDSDLVMLWAVVVAVLLPFPTLIAARLGMPLQDSLFNRMDHAFGVSVPGIRVWASHHWVGALLNQSYTWLLWLLLAAVFAPALMGRLKPAREFLVANLIAFAIGTPLFAVLPAIGPWYSQHFVPNSEQVSCQLQLLALRLPGEFVFSGQQVGVICFPSFHVIWALLCARALWGFRLARIPVALLSTMIVLSTLTTGWHYFSDVLGGLIVAVVSILLANHITSGVVRALPQTLRPSTLAWQAGKAA